MEFLFVPLLAIAAVTFSIHKLAELVFHIHLSCRLLVLLAGFAWLVSLVLPGLFFQSAGFLGSVGLSLVSAVGFAWLATVYDSRTQASQPDLEVFFEQPSNDVLLPAENKVRMDEPDVRDAIETQTDPLEAVEEASELSATDSLEDLLEFAFTQKSRLQTGSALNTFRLIKHLYGESDALAMTVAEIVNILQNSGDYAEAIAELKEILQMPMIRKQESLVRVFEQKLKELQGETA